MGDSAGKALTPKQKRFVAEYLVDSNASAAARRAGYSAKTCSQIAQQTLSVPAVQAALEAGRAKLAERTGVTQAMVVEGLLRETREGDSCSARVSAWGLLGKHLGLFAERLDVNHSGSVTVSITRTVRKA